MKKLPSQEFLKSIPGLRPADGRFPLEGARRRPHPMERKVCRHATITASGKFGAQITINKTHIWLGSHETLAQAEGAYAVAAHNLFGEFARVP
jgi:hypothetical protein